MKRKKRENEVASMAKEVKSQQKAWGGNAGNKNRVAPVRPG